jgi:aminoglycoside phosphotransferase family enzyme/predicted kinase
MVRLEALIRGMSDPAVYPHKPVSVQVIQTHISAVFLAGEFVYKVKKPLNLGFLDFTTLERRRYFCEQEVKLNSRFSEGIYHGVVDICETESGLNLSGQGATIEVAVLMSRIPEDRIMTNMLKKDLITSDILDRLADRIVYFHSHASGGPGIAGFGSAEVIHRNVKENFDQTLPFVGRTIDQNTYYQIERLSLDFIETHGDLLLRRMRGGFIRDCHGDLHVDHVVILDDIMLYDCIEFNDRFRYGDTAADLAFLLMDLDFQGYPAFAKHVAERYAHTSQDTELLKLLSFYRSYRAFVRGKVLGFELEESEISDAERERAVSTANDYFRLSLSYLKPPPRPALIIMCGLMATGKSFIAAKLAKRLGVALLRSDEIRKDLHGVKRSQRRFDMFREGIYTANATERTYEALFSAAEKSLSLGRSIILDASFMSYEHRSRARKLARDAKALFRLIECAAAEEVIKGRLEKRLAQRDEPSDARREILDSQKAAFQPIRSDEEDDHRLWDSTDDPDTFLVSLVKELMFS